MLLILEQKLEALEKERCNLKEEEKNKLEGLLEEERQVQAIESEASKSCMVEEQHQACRGDEAVGQGGGGKGRDGETDEGHG